MLGAVVLTGSVPLQIGKVKADSVILTDFPENAAARRRALGLPPLSHGRGQRRAQPAAFKLPAVPAEQRERSAAGGRRPRSGGGRGTAAGGGCVTARGSPALVTGLCRARGSEGSAVV